MQKYYSSARTGVVRFGPVGVSSAGV
jgi:hypothetical protein